MQRETARYAPWRAACCPRFTRHSARHGGDTHHTRETPRPDQGAVAASDRGLSGKSRLRARDRTLSSAYDQCDRKRARTSVISLCKLHGTADPRGQCAARSGMAAPRRRHAPQPVPPMAPVTSPPLSRHRGRSPAAGAAPDAVLPATGFSRPCRRSHRCASGSAPRSRVRAPHHPKESHRWTPGPSLSVPFRWKSATVWPPPDPPAAA